MENNAARKENQQAAEALDEATLEGWAGHPHLSVIGSDGSVAAKIGRTLAAALHALGDPEPIEAERKFARAAAPDLTHPILAAATRIAIEQIYLPVAAAGEQRIRARTLAGVTTYTHATKCDLGDGTSHRGGDTHRGADLPDARDAA